MRKIGNVIFLSCLILIACSGKDVAYEKTYSLDNSVLTGENDLVFEFENNADTFQLYDVCLYINHESVVSSFQIPLELSYVSPEGASISIPIAIPAFDKNFKPLGKVQVDSSVMLTQTVIYGNKIPTGKNTFKISPATSNDSLIGIKSIKLSIEKAN